MYVQMLNVYIENIINIENIEKIENIGYFRKYHNIFQPCHWVCLITASDIHFCFC